MWFIEMPKERRKFVMTRKRADWVGGRSTTLKGVPMRVNAAFVDNASGEVQAMVKKMHLDISKQIRGLFESQTAIKSIAKSLDKITTESVAMDASISSQSRILMNKLTAKWKKRFNLFGNDFAKKMISTVDRQVSSDLKRSTEKLSGGLNIKTDTLSDRTLDIIIAGTDESSSLIKTIAADYTAGVKEIISRSISTNTGSLTSLRESINDALKGKYKAHKNKAKNIALDQTKKAYSNIAASRMQDIGLDEYIWRHAGGSQVPRHHHKFTLNGEKFKLSDPPVIDLKTGKHGKPGDDYNCSCYMEPVISFG